MSRLASLSTPRRGSPSPASSPKGVVSPAPTLQTETTHHRMLRLVILEMKNLFKTWEEVAGDGVKAGKGVLDEGTIMDNILTLEEGPERELAGPHLEALANYRSGLKAVITKLDRLVGKLGILIEQAEKIYFEAFKLLGVDFAMVDPFWSTWTMEHFINSLPPLLSLHIAHLHLLQSLCMTILDLGTPFDTAKLALERWLALTRGGERWDAVREWEELMELEIDTAAEDEEPEVERRRKGRRG